MITLRPAGERGRTRLDWLDSRHTFSFGDYHDPEHMGFRALRVINDDRVEPGRGFGTHPHRDMEIVTWVLDGALAHRDSLGNGSTIEPGDAQRMSAGTGIAHSEFNPSDLEPVHFLQIWILPRAGGLQPGYEQRPFPREERRGRLRLIAAGDGRDGAITVHQDVDVYAALLERDEAVTHTLRPGRHAWIHVASGAAHLNDRALAAGDGAAASGEERLTLRASEPTEILVFDLA
jgi:hypothetical protein